MYVEFTASEGALYAFARGTYKDTNALANVTVMGVESSPGNVTLNGANVQTSNYNATSKVLSVTNLNNIIAQGAWSQDWILRWG